MTDCLVVGLGIQGRVHAERIECFFPSDIRLRGIVSSKANVQELLDQNPFNTAAPHVFRTIQDIPSSNKYGLIIISSPPAAHFGNLKDLVGAYPEAHFIIDKPLFVKEQEFKEFRDSCSSIPGLADRIIVNLPRRYLSLYNDFKSRIATGEFGKLLFIDVKWDYSVPIILKGTSFRASDSGENGGALFEAGSHIFDLIRWLSGEEFGVVTGLLQSIDSETNTSAAISGRLGSGTLVSVAISGTSLRSKTRFSMRISTDSGVLDFEDDDLVSIRRPGGQIEKELRRISGAIGGQLKRRGGESARCAIGDYVKRMNGERLFDSCNPEDFEKTFLVLNRIVESQRWLSEERA